MLVLDSGYKTVSRANLNSCSYGFYTPGSAVLRLGKTGFHAKETKMGRWLGTSDEGQLLFCNSVISLDSLGR